MDEAQVLEHRVTIFQRTPPIGEAYFSSECSCGWFGKAHGKERAAREEADTHANPTVGNGPTRSHRLMRLFARSG